MGLVQNKCSTTMEFRGLILAALVLLSLAGIAHGSVAERKLLAKIFEGYIILERPTVGSRDIVNVSIGLTLLSISNVDTRANFLETNFWMTLEWFDSNLHWNPSEYDNITSLRIPPSKLWKPDVYLYNSQHEDFDPTFETMVVLKSNGSIVYIPPGIHKTTCQFDLTYYPYDYQKCNFKFGSWVYDGGEVDLHLSNEAGGDSSSYIPNPEWSLIGLPAVKDKIYYACCKEPYVSVTYTVNIRRKGHIILMSYKVVNAFICLLILLSFIMPVDSGQKLAIGIVTAILNIYTISSINSEMPTHHTSWLAFYFVLLENLTFSSILANIFTVYVHYRSFEMPTLVRKLLLEKLPRSFLRFICPLRKSEVADSEQDDFHHAYMPVGSSDDSQGLISEINNLKRRMSVQTQARQLASDWHYLSVVIDRCFIIVYALAIFVFYVAVFPSFDTSDDLKT